MSAKPAAQFEEALALALRLSPLDKARLVERVASTLGRELAGNKPAEQDVPEGPPQHWGKQLIALLDEMDLSAWQAEDLDDPVEWVKRQRREQDERYSDRAALTVGQPEGIRDAGGNYGV